VFEYVYRLSVANGPQAVSGLVAQLTGGGTGLSVVQGSVFVGDLASGATVAPAGTITIRQDRTSAFNESALAWTLTPFLPPSGATCAALAANVGETSLFPPTVSITSVTFVAPAGTTPEHCNVLGQIAPRVGEQSSPGVTQNLGFPYSTGQFLLNQGRFSAAYFSTQMYRMRDAYVRYARPDDRPSKQD
jgi:hypothetical protein